MGRRNQAALLAKQKSILTNKLLTAAVQLFISFVEDSMKRARVICICRIAMQMTLANSFASSLNHHCKISIICILQLQNKADLQTTELQTSDLLWDFMWRYENHIGMKETLLTLLHLDLIYTFIMDVFLGWLCSAHILPYFPDCCSITLFPVAAFHS